MCVCVCVCVCLCVFEGQCLGPRPGGVRSWSVHPPVTIHLQKQRMCGESGPDACLGRRRRLTRVLGLGSGGFVFRVLGLGFGGLGFWVLQIERVSGFGFWQSEWRNTRCRANMAQIRQSRPDFGLGLSHFQCRSPFRACPPSRECVSV